MRCPPLITCSLFVGVLWQSSYSLPESNPNHAGEEGGEVELARCAWGVGLEFGSCGKVFCMGEYSANKYGQFLFHESIYHAKSKRNRTIHAAGRRRLLYDTATCLFIRNDVANKTSTFEFCSCEYPAVAEFCYNLHHRIDVNFKGDSTIGKFERSVMKTCNSTAMGAAEQFPDSSKRQVWLVNEATLHYLYLPFAREEDRATKEGPTMLLRSMASLEEYTKMVSGFLAEVVSSASSDAIIVYMRNNEVCPLSYAGAYRDAWRWTLETPTLDTFKSIATRRGTDLFSSLTMTLDYYGSSLMSRLIAKTVLPMFPQLLIMPFPPQYPGSCLITKEADGRHFDQASYYDFKLRLFWHILKPALGNVVGSP